MPHDDREPSQQPPPAPTRRRWPEPVRAGWRVARTLLVAYLLVVLLMTLLETWLVYPIPPLSAGDWQPTELGSYEEVRFAAADGTKLHGWFVPHRQPARVILYFHGNGEHVGMNAALVARLRDSLAASVFIFDYRGYGRSEGRPSEAGCIADGVAAQRWLSERTGRAAEDMVLMGRSLGAAVAIAVAAEHGAQALVLENGFARMTDVAAYHYRWLPVRLLMRNRYDSVARIGQFDGPVWQSHGAVDRIVPVELARELYAASESPRKQFVELADVGHNDPPPPGYHARLAQFLDTATGHRGAGAPAADPG